MGRLPGYAAIVAVAALGVLVGAAAFGDTLSAGAQQVGTGAPNSERPVREPPDLVAIAIGQLLEEDGESARRLTCAQWRAKTVWAALCASTARSTATTTAASHTDGGGRRDHRHRRRRALSPGGRPHAGGFRGGVLLFRRPLCDPRALARRLRVHDGGDVGRVDLVRRSRAQGQDNRISFARPGRRGGPASPGGPPAFLCSAGQRCTLPPQAREGSIGRNHSRHPEPLQPHG